jgi:hypothetical protein
MAVTYLLNHPHLIQKNWFMLNPNPLCADYVLHSVDWLSLEPNQWVDFASIPNMDVVNRLTHMLMDRPLKDCDFCCVCRVVHTSIVKPWHHMRFLLSLCKNPHDEVVDWLLLYYDDIMTCSSFSPDRAMESFVVNTNGRMIQCLLDHDIAYALRNLNDRYFVANPHPLAVDWCRQNYLIPALSKHTLFHAESLLWKCLRNPNPDVFAWICRAALETTQENILSGATLTKPISGIVSMLTALWTNPNIFVSNHSSVSDNASVLLK